MRTGSAQSVCEPSIFKSVAHSQRKIILVFKTNVLHPAVKLESEMELKESEAQSGDRSREQHVFPR